MTGSGKTEVYLRAAAAALERGEGVIALVPEIALTPQTVARFSARFGDTVALLHSALSEGERYDEWRRLRTGEARIAVGPRSAVFAPVERLGLIVVDEEHDSSYKHEGDPRYDARHVAAYRAYQTGARLLAGSATPRPETVHRMARLRLPTRVAGGNDLPPVRVLDMREAAPLRCTPRRGARSAPRASRSCCSTGAAGRTSSPARPAGRRGSARTATSRSSCTAPTTRSTCHHCGHRERVPDRCDACGSLAVARHGAGTERVEAELRHALRVPVFRLDADTTTNKDAVPALLARFAAAPEGLLLGTQMVAKGHDFPDVTLGVVLDADSTLRFPDFRAEERTFALIAQLAGRAGRGPKGGRVLVQTNTPDAAAIVAASRHDADGFLRERAQRRRGWGYPPFSDLIRIVTSTLEDAAGARAAAARLAQDLAEVRDTELLGPAPAVPPAQPRALPARAQDHRPRRRDRSRRRSRRGRRPRPHRSRTSTSPSTSIRPDSRKIKGSDPFRIVRMSDEVHTEAHGQVAEPQEKLDPETRARREAALRLVRKYGDPVLRSRALEIERFDDALLDEVRRMGALMHDAYGIGLAATQVGVMHRLLVYRTELEGSVAALVNPVLEWSSKEKETSEEGCLSLPGVGVEVERPGARAGARPGRARRARSWSRRAASRRA